MSRMQLIMQFVCCPQMMLGQVHSQVSGAALNAVEMSMAGLAHLLKLLDQAHRSPGYSSEDLHMDATFPFNSGWMNSTRLYDDNLPLIKSIASSFCPYMKTRYNAEKRLQSNSNVGKDGFQVCIDVAQFKPNELTVKVVGNFVVVEGKHEERQDEFGFIQRHFTRRYQLPPGYEGDKVISTLSSDGVLTIKVPVPQLRENANERIVQIQQTGPAHLCVKTNPEEQPHDGRDDNAPCERGGDEKK